VDRIIAASSGRDLLDVGYGTGTCARLFRVADCRVLDVDPDPRMAELARQGGTVTKVAKFEGRDWAGRTFDVVIVFRMLDSVFGQGSARLARHGNQPGLHRVSKVPVRAGDALQLPAVPF
jgi:SAM-dependent methyltransferase